MSIDVTKLAVDWDAVNWFKLLTELFKDAVVEFIFEILILTLALFTSNEDTLWLLLWVYALNDAVVTNPLISTDEVNTGVPLTVKLPCTLTLPLRVCMSVNSSPNWFDPLEYITDAVSYKVCTYWNDADTAVMFVNVWFAVKLLSIFVLAKDAVSLSVIQLLLTAFIASILICWDADDAFNWVTELFKDAVVVSILVNLVNVDALNVFKLFIDICADAVKVFKEAVDAPIALLIVNWDEVNAFKAVMSADAVR